MYTPEVLIAPLVAVSLGIAILSRSPSNRLYQVFATLCGAVGLYYLATGLAVLAPNIFWMRLSNAALGITAFSCYQFFSRFPEGLHDKNRKEGFLWLLGGLGIVVLTCLPHAVFNPLIQVIGLLSFTWIEFLALALVSLALWRSLQLLIKQYRQTLNPIRQTRLKILLFGGYLTVFFVALEVFDFMPPLGHIAVVIFLYFLYQALLQYRLLDLQEILARGCVLALQAIVLTGVFLALFFLTGNLTSPPSAKIQYLIFDIFVSVGIIIILDEPLRKVFDKLAKKVFFYSHFAFETLIEKTRGELPGKINEEEAISYTLKSLHSSGRISNGSVYLFEETLNVLRLKDKFGEKPELPQVISDSRWINYIRKHGNPIILEKLAHKLDETSDLRKPMLQHVLHYMEALDAQLALPLLSSAGSFTGILLLKDRGFNEAFSNSEIRLLMTLAGQLATTLRSLQLYNQFLTRDRLVELGEMAAGLAHEIRNPLGAIKGAAQYLSTLPPEGEKDSAATEDKFLNIIVEEVDRLNRVVEQFLTFARSETRPQTRGNINLLLEHTVKLLTVNGFRKKYELDLKLGADLPPVPMDAERMKQVFLNLSINALQAMPSGGTLHIASRICEKGEAEVEFSDTGSGLKETEIPKIFAPFYTTKDNGSGLGLAICKRIIEDHGGRIEVDAKGPHGGARFRVRLYYDEAPEPDVMGSVMAESLRRRQNTTKG